MLNFLISVSHCNVTAKKCICTDQFCPIREAPENHAQITTLTWAGKLSSVLHDCVSLYTCERLVRDLRSFVRQWDTLNERIRTTPLTEEPIDRPIVRQTFRGIDRPTYGLTDGQTNRLTDRMNRGAKEPNQSIGTQTSKVDSQLNRQFSL